jgi:hypothetical protein
MTDKKFILLNGREFNSDELTRFYRNNLRNGNIPVAGYFCPLCRNEVLYNKNFVCSHCNIKEEN